MSLNISVLIPAYNCDLYIEQCIDSVVNQEHTSDVKYEIIVGVDGCEETLNKLIQIKDKYENLVVMHMQTNTGCYVTLNTMIPQARYDNIMIIGADDLIDNRMFEAISRIEKPYDILRWRYKQFTDDVSTSIPVDNYANGSIVIKKYVFDKCGGFHSNRYSSDLELLMRVRYFTKTIFISDYLYFYRNGEGHKNLTSSIPLQERIKFDSTFRNTTYSDDNVYLKPTRSQYILL